MKKFLALAIVALVSFAAFCYEEPTKPSPEEVILQNGGHSETNPLYVGTLATEEWVSNQVYNVSVDASNKFITCEIGKYFTTNVTIGSVRRVEMNIAANAEEGYIRINEGTPFSYNPMLGLTNIVLALDSVVYEFVPEPLDNGGLKINCKSATGINTNIMFSASEAVPRYATNLVDALNGSRMNNAKFDGSVFFNGEIRQTFSNVKDSNEKSLKSYLDERLTSTEAEDTYLKKDGVQIVNPIAKFYDAKKEVTWDVVMVDGEMKIFAVSPYDETEYIKVNSVIMDESTLDNWHIRMDNGEMKFKTQN